MKVGQVFNAMKCKRAVEWNDNILTGEITSTKEGFSLNTGADPSEPRLGRDEEMPSMSVARTEGIKDPSS